MVGFMSLVTKCISSEQSVLLRDNLFFLDFITLHKEWHSHIIRSSNICGYFSESNENQETVEGDSQVSVSVESVHNNQLYNKTPLLGKYFWKALSFKSIDFKADYLV